MKREQMILLAAVGFAAVLVAKKSGMLNGKKAPAWVPTAIFHRDSPFAESPEDEGYRQDDPGAFVFVDDLVAGLSEKDWNYTPTVFEQKVDDVLYRPTYRVP